MPNLAAASKVASGKYNQETSAKLKLVDNLAALALAVFVVQLVYGGLFCRDPFNSFIAGLFCSMGVFAMTVGLRIQLSNNEFQGQSKKQMVFEYILGCLIMFFASLLLMG